MRSRAVLYGIAKPACRPDDLDVIGVDRNPMGAISHRR